MIFQYICHIFFGRHPFLSIRKQNKHSLGVYKWLHVRWKHAKQAIITIECPYALRHSIEWLVICSRLCDQHIMLNGLDAITGPNNRTHLIETNEMEFRCQQKQKPTAIYIPIEFSNAE